jgi:hypothetical protein
VGAHDDFFLVNHTRARAILRTHPKESGGSRIHETWICTHKFIGRTDVCGPALRAIVNNHGIFFRMYIARYQESVWHYVRLYHGMVSTV